MKGLAAGVLGVVLGIPALLLVVLIGGVSPGAAGATALGPAVPAAYHLAILAASASCPGLPAPVLAAQIDTESGFNPRAVSPAGAQGIAQFMPGTWTTWGTDGNGDGFKDPFDPDDAIAAQGRFMCALLEQFKTMKGTPVIELALAAYNAGPGAVDTYHGIPPYPETRTYVTAIMTKAASPDFAVAPAAAANGKVDTMMPKGVTNPRTSEQAVQWALRMVGEYQYSGHCLRFVTLAYGYSAGLPYAYQVWETSPEYLHHPKDLNPPRGAVLVWDPRTGDGAGHIAIALGDGRMVTTTGGAISIMKIDAYIDMGYYYGWMPPYIQGT